MADSSPTAVRKRRMSWLWQAPLALVLALGIAVLVATTIYGANRHPAPAPVPSGATTSLYRPPAPTPSPDHPAPAQAPVNEVIRQIQNDPDLSVGLAITSVALPQNREQSTLAAGTITSGMAWQTIDVAMALAILDQERQPEDRGYLFRRSLAENSTAGSDAIWAFLGDPAQAAEKTNGQLRKYGDWKTQVPQDGRRGYPAYMATDWSLNEQAQFMAAVSCSYRQTNQVLTHLDEHDPAESFGLAVLPGAFVKTGQGLQEKGEFNIRQFGIIQLADGTEVAVSLSVSSGQRDEAAVRAALTTLAKSISTQVSGFAAPACG